MSNVDIVITKHNSKFFILDFVLKTKRDMYNGYTTHYIYLKYYPGVISSRIHNKYSEINLKKELKESVVSLILIYKV